MLLVKVKYKIIMHIRESHDKVMKA